MKTLAYIRVSSHRQAQEGFSLDMQTNKIIEYCKFYNLPEPKIYADKGISGKKSENRPQFQLLLAEVEKNDKVLFYSLSRFARNTIETLQIAEIFKKRNIAMISITEKAIDTSDANGELILTILAAVAKFDNQKRAENISHTKQDLKSQNKPYCGCLTGYKNTFDLTEEGKRINGRLEPTEHLETIKEIFRLHQSGIGAYAIATKLNQKGVKSVNGNKFYQSSIIKILENQIYRPNMNTLLVNAFQKFGSKIPATSPY